MSSWKTSRSRCFHVAPVSICVQVRVTGGVGPTGEMSAVNISTIPEAVSFTKINSEWITDLNAMHRGVSKVYKSDSNFSDSVPKAQAIRG